MTDAFKPLTKDDVSKLLNISERTIENWVNDGTLPSPSRLGNRVYWHPHSFYTWLDKALTATETDTGAPLLDDCEGQAQFTRTAVTGKAKNVPKSEAGLLRARDQAKLNALSN